MHLWSWQSCCAVRSKSPIIVIAASSPSFLLMILSLFASIVKKVSVKFEKPYCSSVSKQSDLCISSIVSPLLLRSQALNVASIKSTVTCFNRKKYIYITENVGVRKLTLENSSRAKDNSFLFFLIEYHLIALPLAAFETTFKKLLSTHLRNLGWCKWTRLKVGWQTYWWSFLAMMPF